MDSIEPGEAFWSELIEHGAADAVLIAEFKCDALDHPWKPLGRILLEEGFISMNEMVGLLANKLEDPQLRIGDLAIRDGLCTPAQIGEALRVQRDNCPGPIEFIRRDPRVGQAALTNALVGYVHHLEGVVHCLRTQLRVEDA